LHTPCETGDTRWRVLNANWLYKWYRRPTMVRSSQKRVAPTCDQSMAAAQVA
jgi:hypothetical protein